MNIAIRVIPPLLAATLATARPAARSADPATNLPAALATRPAAGAVFVALDTETTGLSTRRDRVIEIAAVKFRGDETIAHRSWLVNPGTPIPEEARRVHGITDGMVSRSPDFRSVFPEFAAFVGDAVLLAHNASFDTGILRAELRRNGLSGISNAVIDTRALFRCWYPDAGRYTAGALADYLSVPTGRLHRAEGDAGLLRALFLAGITNRPAGTTVGDLARQAGRLYELR